MAFPPRPVPMCVAVCEADDDVRHALLAGLGSLDIHGFGVASAESLNAVLASRGMDAVVLGDAAEGLEGGSLVLALRQAQPQLGIVLLSAPEERRARLRGLEDGADLYCLRPVDPRELAALLRNLQHRREGGARAVAPGAWRLERSSSELITPSGKGVLLTAPEGRVLGELMDHAGVTLAKGHLVSLVMDGASVGGERRLESLLTRLRRKVLKASPGEPLPVIARIGEGYAFLARVQPR